MPQLDHSPVADMLKFLLLPVALFAAVFAIMPAHIMTTSLHRQMEWNEIMATVTRAETLCALTYQPDDAVLRQTAAVAPCESIEKTPLPAGASRPRVFDDVYGALTYVVAGNTLRWEGKLADAGVYNAKIGAIVPLLYDPNDPTRLDTAEMKGWLGGLTLMLAAGGFVAFYGWFFWLRGRR